MCYRLKTRRGHQKALSPDCDRLRLRFRHVEARETRRHACLGPSPKGVCNAQEGNVQLSAETSCQFTRQPLGH